MQPKINLPYVIFLAATASLGGLLFGFDIAIITGAGPFLIQHFKLSDLSLGWAFSSLLFGCVIGSTVVGRLTDFYGRRKILLWVAVLFAVTSVATGLASTLSPPAFPADWRWEPRPSSRPCILPKSRPRP